jgi:putative ABC transport system substrate-binding protein
LVGGDAERLRKNAADFAALAPDVIQGWQLVDRALPGDSFQPVMFVTAADPVGAGFVDSLARPNGNATAFAFDTVSARNG